MEAPYHRMGNTIESSITPITLFSIQYLLFHFFITARRKQRIPVLLRSPGEQVIFLIQKIDFSLFTVDSINLKLAMLEMESYTLSLL